jgi:hypothetical protein
MSSIVERPARTAAQPLQSRWLLGQSLLLSAITIRLLPSMSNADRQCQRGLAFQRLLLNCPDQVADALPEAGLAAAVTAVMMHDEASQCGRE